MSITGQLIPNYAQLEPKVLWDVFARISAVPRPSEREQLVRETVQSIADQHQWETFVDGGGNLIIRVPATSGRESSEPLILQAHLDMVTIKREHSQHDFDNDPIPLSVREHDGCLVVSAGDTTLGADNGIGVAAALAVAISPDLNHGPLELLLTTNEESGMTGAKALDASLLRGKRMINLDTEEDDAVYIGCVGGGKVLLTWQCRPEPPLTNQSYVAIFVSGLRGGHSGLEIHQNRGNAIQLMARTIAQLQPNTYRLACLDGGNRHNAIPDHAAAVVAGDASLWQQLMAAAMRVKQEAASELGKNARKLTIVCEPMTNDMPPILINTRQSSEIIQGILSLPHGVLGRDANDANMIESSSNVAIVQTKEDGAVKIEVEISTRSLVQERLADIHREYQKCAETSSAEFVGEFKYPPWQPRHDSPLLSSACSCYEELFNETPRVASIHGGLECAIIGSKVPGIDMVSIGPRIEEAHTPDERVYVESVQKFWRFLTALLSKLN